MNKHERIAGALSGQPVDRTPISLWRHFHREDRTAEGLAEATLALCTEIDLDLVKMTPSGLYAVEDWAVGQITYPGTEHEPPFLHRPAISGPAAWRGLALLDPHCGALGRELRALRLAAAG